MLKRYCDLCGNQIIENEYLIEVTKFVENPATGVRESKPAIASKECCSNCKEAVRVFLETKRKV